MAFIAWGVFGTGSLGAVTTAVLNGVMRGGGWAFVLAASGFVVFCLWLAFSRNGRIPLGRDGEAPESRTVSWGAMMFSAGMGIGLMFYGVNEPLTDFTSPPPGTVAPGSPAALDVAMATTLFHWTLHPWAIYAVVGLAIAYGSFRRGRSQLISSAFAPLIGQRRASGPIGRAIDVLAIFATLFGSAASLDLGALQIGGGLKAGGYLDNAGTALLVVVIAVLTVAFVASAVSGVAKGIQWLSNINMVLAGLLAVFVFVAGPTILIPSLVSLLWFAIFGGAAVSLQRSGVDLAARSPEEQLFGVLDAYPLGVALGVVAMLLVRRAGQGAAQRPARAPRRPHQGEGHARRRVRHHPRRRALPPARRTEEPRLTP